MFFIAHFLSTLVCCVFLYSPFKERLAAGHGGEAGQRERLSTQSGRLARKREREREKDRMAPERSLQKKEADHRSEADDRAGSVTPTRHRQALLLCASTSIEHRKCRPAM